MSSCCNGAEVCGPTNRFFSRWSRRYTKSFRRSGLDKTQRYLLEGVRKEPIASKEVLDIGCGVGALHLTLLLEGAAAATGVDISEGMLDEAKKFAEENRLQEKTRYLLGDFVEESRVTGDADITLLDKVVCCYKDYEVLLERSAAKTRSIYAVSHPKNSVLMRSIFTLQIFVLKLFRGSFYPFWHDWNDVHRRILSYGFQLIYSNSTIAWQVLVYKRTALHSRPERKS